MTLQPLILCGGAGSRLWPLSREQYPKQLLALTGDETLLQATVRRLAGYRGDADLRPPLLVTNEEYRFVTAEQLHQVDVRPEALIIEPEGRNTAPALTLAALVATADGADPILLVMPADHVVAEPGAFCAAVAEGARHAAAKRLVALGVKPDRAEPGYGYIRVGRSIADSHAFVIDSFVEKPDAELAESYFSSGEYLWNSGIFMMLASVWLEHLGRCRPDILEACRAAYAGRKQEQDFLRVGAEAFLQCPADSIDYAVMERIPAGAGVVVPLASSWSDVGAWDALWQISPRDTEDNAFRGDVVAIDTRSCLAISNSRLVACVGLEDMLVVETADAILVAPKSRAQDVKKIALRLRHEHRSEGHVHRRIHRPWGFFESVDAGARFQVKRLMVNAGARLSLQMHFHRAEHWTVVSGTARVTCGEDEFLLEENQSAYIPLGQPHRLENPGRIPLEIIEVQSGAYLGEDDIVRFEDTYGRT
ncbi:MAG: mannose-1-phosphate guanylyltransferase/mannose-6-phosphate isomerase [Rhodocyclaceae bacterium]|nr:MAG: mannose-1-phosphate guanylyltransferase/mannose-6-phosphate isomerase [Rhodocyclaceae bacterium]